MQPLTRPDSTSAFIAIVLLNYNGLEDTRKCLESIERIPYRPLQIIVVDNASAEDPTEILQAEFPRCIVLRSETNQGWAGGNNIGIRHTLPQDAEYVILLNNDTLVSEELVYRLVHAAQGRPEFGVIGPVINHMVRPDEVQTDGCLFIREDGSGFFQRKPVERKRCSPPAITEVDIVNGCCMMISKRVFETIGLIDERFFLIHEESDFCLRARQAGFLCGVIGESLVWHKHSASFTRAGNWRQRYYDVRNLFLLLRLHSSTYRQKRLKCKAWLTYFKHVYYCYSLEREHLSEQGMKAVVQGFHDALSGRFGPWAPRKTTSSGLLLQGLLETAWKLRGSKTAEHQPLIEANQ
jgi:GT2 family glycosyltransferase